MLSPKLQECMEPWIQTKGALLRAHVADEPRNPQRLRAHRRGRTSAPSGVTVRRRIRGISQMKARLRSSANHGSRRRQGPAIQHAPRSHAATLQALEYQNTQRPPHKPPEDILAVMEPGVVLVWDSSQNDRDDLRDSRSWRLYLGEFRRTALARDATEDR